MQIVIFCGGIGEKATHEEDIIGRHSAVVLVARIVVFQGEPRNDAVDDLCRKIGASDLVGAEQPRNVEGGLVGEVEIAFLAMVVIEVVDAVLARPKESACEGLGTAHGLDQSRHIVVIDVGRIPARGLIEVDIVAALDS